MNTVGVLCQNFSECKTVVDVTHLPKLNSANINTTRINERFFCEACSEKIKEEKRKNNKTLFPSV
jgi:hypothetical protein